MTTQVNRRGWWERKTYEYPALLYLDFLLIAYVSIMAAAIVITSHGTYTFYRFFLDSYLALAATVVIGAGMPLFESGVVISETRRDKIYFFAGLLLFAGLEATAQYWFGQSMFRSSVAKFFAGQVEVDLVALSTDPIMGRALPIAYLAAISLLVLLLGYGASTRFKIVRKLVHSRYEKSDHEAALQLEVAQLGDKLTAAEADKQSALQELRAQLETRMAQAAQAAQELLERATNEVQRLTALLEGADGRVDTSVAAAERRAAGEIERLTAQLQGSEAGKLELQRELDRANRYNAELERAKEREELQHSTAMAQLQAQHEAALATARAEAAQDALGRVRAERISDMPQVVATNGNGSRGRLRAQVIEIVNEAWARGEEGITREQIAGLLEILNPDGDTLKYIGEIASRRKGEIRKGAAQPEEG